MHVRKGDLRGRHHVEIPITGNLEKIGLELREVAGSGQGRAVDHEGRLDFSVAMTARMQMEHEVDQRPCEPRARPDQDREPRASDLRAALEIDDAESRTEIPVRLRVEVERRRRSVPTNFDVVRAAFADGHALVRQVGNRQQTAISPLLDHVQLDVLSCLICCARWRLASWILLVSSPCAFRTRDFIAGGVLFTLEPFELGQESGGGAIPALRALRARSTNRRHAFEERPAGPRGCRAVSPDPACCRFYLR